ncbi:hypothetical protein [Geobacillus subterraneus]|uniref:Uncharacterized protein n=1 Tax=Geobacillus subterraneus TaxID=129338 RepID=A0A679FQM6_9BACL|nr:hypothetical protein [Geobacillus subterraneus]BBW98868.1 hypothetical protein GsuE55_37010 [Geobacillus subterraneus]
MEYLKTIQPKHIRRGMVVDIVVDGKIQRGYVREVLSKGLTTRGVKVRLHDGKEGKIVHIPTKSELWQEQIKFYNSFLFGPVYGYWNIETQQWDLLLYDNPYTGQVERTIVWFQQEQDAMSFLPRLPHASILSIRRLSKKRLYADQIQPLAPDYIRIDGQRKITYQRFREIEQLLRQQ